MTSALSRNLSVFVRCSTLVIISSEMLTTLAFICLLAGISLSAPVDYLNCREDVEQLVDSLKFRLRYTPGQHDSFRDTRADLPCWMCQALILAVRAEFLSNKTETAIGDLATRICIKLHIEDSPVCQAVVTEFRV